MIRILTERIYGFLNFMVILKRKESTSFTIIKGIFFFFAKVENLKIFKHKLNKKPQKFCDFVFFILTNIVYFSSVLRK